jgi:hypothetical protein
MIFLRPLRRLVRRVVAFLAAAGVGLTAVAPEPAEAATAQAARPGVVRPTAVYPVVAAAQHVRKAKADGPHVEVPELDWPAPVPDALHEPVRARMILPRLRGRVHQSVPVLAQVPVSPS